MNLYENRYNQLINHFKNIQFEGYTENHHIIPRCMGGSNAKENLVKLSAKAHYIAHHLLHKAFPENKKLANAFGMMLCGNKRQERRFSAKMYEQSRIAIAESKRGVPRLDISERNKNSKGIKRGPMPDHVKEILRIKNLGIKRPENIERNKIGKWNLGKTISDSAKLLIGESNKGEKNGNSKISDLQAKEIYARANKGENQSKIAKDYGITQSAVSIIKLNKSRKEAAF